MKSSKLSLLLLLVTAFVVSSIHIIFRFFMFITICLVPPFLEDEYLRMTTEFATILKRFVIQIFKEKEKLKDVQISLVGINPKNKKEIDEVDNETGLTVVLRNYCSLSNFQILTSLAKDLKMSDITKELNEFEKKRDKLYKEILAKDFAKSAIEYCGTTGSREVRSLFAL